MKILNTFLHSNYIIKGSVFATFDKSEEMVAFLEIKELTFKDCPLIIESQSVEIYKALK